MFAGASVRVYVQSPLAFLRLLWVGGRYSGRGVVVPNRSPPPECFYDQAPSPHQGKGLGGSLTGEGENKSIFNLLQMRACSRMIQPGKTGTRLVWRSLSAAPLVQR